MFQASGESGVTDQSFRKLADDCSRTSSCCIGDWVCIDNETYPTGVPLGGAKHLVAVTTWHSQQSEGTFEDCCSLIQRGQALEFRKISSISPYPFQSIVYLSHYLPQDQTFLDGSVELFAQPVLGVWKFEEIHRLGAQMKGRLSARLQILMQILFERLEASMLFQNSEAFFSFKECSPSPRLLSSSSLISWRQNVEKFGWNVWMMMNDLVMSKLLQSSNRIRSNCWAVGLQHGPRRWNQSQESKASAGFVAEVKRKPAADVQVVSSQGIPTDYKWLERTRARIS